MLINQKRVLVLKSKRNITPRSIELTYESNDLIPYIPGQFFSVEFPVGEDVRARSYSIVNQSRDITSNKEFVFVITLVESGVASEYFSAAEPGSEVSISGPFGNLILPKSVPERFILIATGAGIAPYRSMIPQIEQRIIQAPELKVEVLMGARNKAELMYADEFLELADHYEGFNFSAYYSREKTEKLTAFEHLGYVIDHYDRLKAAPQRDLVYLCGHPQMIDDSVAYFEQLGFSPSNLKREKYLYSAL